MGRRALGTFYMPIQPLWAIRVLFYMGRIAAVFLTVLSATLAWAIKSVVYAVCFEPRSRGRRI